MRGMRRPKAIVVPEGALVHRRTRVEPPPNCFTHRVRRRQAYYEDMRAAPPAAGYFTGGTLVVLMVHDGGRMCRVVDGQGRYVLTAFAGLAPLAATDRAQGASS